MGSRGREENILEFWSQRQCSFEQFSLKRLLIELSVCTCLWNTSGKQKINSAKYKLVLDDIKTLPNIITIIKNGNNVFMSLPHFTFVLISLESSRFKSTVQKVNKQTLPSPYLYIINNFNYKSFQKTKHSCLQIQNNDSEKKSKKRFL